jgi:hypothetical protein
MERTFDDSLKKAFERARERLLKNMPLLAQAGDSGVGADAMTAGEIRALESVGLAVSRWKEGADADPLRRSIRDYMRLLETSYTTSEAANFLKVDSSWIRRRLRERSLFGFDYEGRKRLPRFQFERGGMIPGLREVLAVLPKNLNLLDLAEWFLSPNPDLEVEDMDLSPREWLLSGRMVAPVVALAGGLGQFAD